jgi:hypothetical protein
MCKVFLCFLFVFCTYYFRSSSKLNRTENIPRWLFVGGLMSYLRYVCLLTHSGVKHILFCIFVLFFFVLCTLCCKILWIVHLLIATSVFSNVDAQFRVLFVFGIYHFRSSSKLKLVKYAEILINVRIQYGYIFFSLFHCFV